MDIRTMIHLARSLIPNYDIHARTGFPPNIPIPNKNAAYQIVMDMRRDGLFLPFINLLITAGDTGFMGRRYRVPHLREIVQGICKTGFLYDRESGMFVEDPLVRKTNNWGVLRDGEEYIFTFLRMDIVGNSDHVRTNLPEVVKAAYADLRSIMQIALEKRNGRLWNWEGDGGLGAFYFSQKNNAAALAAMEIIHELFLYNHLHCRLEEPLRVRIAVHSGQCQFRNDFEDFNNDIMKQIAEMESVHTQPDTVTCSSNVYTMLDSNIAEQLQPLRTRGASAMYFYALNWEKGKP